MCCSDVLWCLIVFLVLDRRFFVVYALHEHHSYIYLSVCVCVCVFVYLHRCDESFYTADQSLCSKHTVHFHLRPTRPNDPTPANTEKQTDSSEHKHTKPTYTHWKRNRPVYTHNPYHLHWNKLHHILYLHWGLEIRYILHSVSWIWIP